MREQIGNEKSWTDRFEIPISDIERAKKFYDTVFDTDIHLIDVAPQFKMGIFPHKDVGCALCWSPEYYKPSTEGVTVNMNASGSKGFSRPHRGRWWQGDQPQKADR